MKLGVEDALLWMSVSVVGVVLLALLTMLVLLFRGTQS